MGRCPEETCPVNGLLDIVLSWKAVISSWDQVLLCLFSLKAHITSQPSIAEQMERCRRAGIARAHAPDMPQNAAPHVQRSAHLCHCDEHSYLNEILGTKYCDGTSNPVCSGGLSTRRLLHSRSWSPTYHVRREALGYPVPRYPEGSEGGNHRQALHCVYVQW